MHKSRGYSSWIPVLLGVWLGTGSPLILTAAGADAGIRFNRDIRPILSENCLACHGPDPLARKANLRLDTREGFFASSEKRGPTVVSGQPGKSPLYQRLITTDPDDLMPPPESHKSLKPEEKERVKRWIEQGAPWEAHWAFNKPERPPVPQPADLGDWARNPIDFFVLETLLKKGLKPAAEADRRTIARRLSLDLTGLPPSPAEVESFVRDRSPHYYEKYVDQLMASPHWGEHRGRYWLDAARYADTHGLHFDNYREMWPYRDWVIQAFNRNTPFDQFTLEQLAGDLLPDPSPDQLVATGFHRCNPTTNEGGTIEEENLFIYAKDRVETTSWVWLGLTANCAVCHDHKYDPISARDFYSMSAFFRNTTQTGFDGNVKESNPNMILVDSETERLRLKALPAEIEEARKALEPARKAADPALEKWLEELKPEELERRILSEGLVGHIPLNEGTTQQVAVVTGRGTNRVNTGGTVTLRTKGRTGPVPQWEAGSSVEFRQAGNFDRDEAFSVSLWSHVPASFDGKAAILSRMESGKRLRGWDLTHEHGHYSVHFIHDWPDDAIRLRTKFRVVNRGGLQHVAFTYDGTGQPEGIKLYVNGKQVEVEADRVRRLTGTFRTRAALRIAPHEPGPQLAGLAVQDIRIYDRVVSPAEMRFMTDGESIRDWFKKPVAERKPEPRQVLQEYFLSGSDAGYQASLMRLRKLEREIEGYRLNHPVTHVQRERPNTAPTANILMRGQYDKPGEKVGPAVFAALNPMPADAPKNRLGLARWILSEDNPLTARVTVNRFWQEVFGIGLVRTADDFGIMGEPPSHPELLDWLSVEFREKGWDIKAMIRLMVTSATYRQGQDVTSEKLEKDPTNRHLSRGPRFRMDAEMVRDYALRVSGLLDPTLGGPSVRPYQPEGVWEAVAMPESNTRYYHEGAGSDLYRRSLYTLWKRAAPPASMELFNAPARETSCLRRERTNTPLQALATLNDPQFVEAARHLARSVLRHGSRRRDRVLDALSLKVLARPLTAEERTVVLANLDQFISHYAAHPDEARQLIEVGASDIGGSPDAPLLAAWTLTANQLLNLDETLNK